MHRIHSDVSEYDPQGNLLKRTITDSYTSLVDAAQPPLQRYNSSPGPQSLLPTNHPPNLDKVCSYCSDSRSISTRASLTRHLCVEHSDLFVRAQKYKKLQEAYRRRTSQLCQALRFLESNNVEHPSAEEPWNATQPEWVTEALKDLELDSLNVDPEDGEDEWE
jgi:hypothetical protein